MTIDRSQRFATARVVVGWGITATLLMVWAIALAPTVVGGPATFVMVDGQSMEPMLHTGDLVVARTRSRYEVGDLVVFGVSGGHVIHKLHGGSPGEGWTAKGINNNWIDPWVVPDSEIAGEYWFVVPGFSAKLQWPRKHPLVFGLIAAAIAMLTYAPRRRRRLAPALAVALEHAHREPRAARATGGEGVAFGIAAMGVCVSLMGLANVLASRVLLSWHGATILLSLVISGGIAAFFAGRIFEGRGLAEPEKTLRTLSGRLRRVESFPELPSGTALIDVKSAAELVLIAEKYRLPVLHTVSKGAGEQGFLVITANRGAYYWSVANSESGDESQGNPSGGHGSGSEPWVEIPT